MQADTARRRIHNEINITPLTDVFLVLLIIMMMLQTTAALKYAGQIHPPEVAGADRVKQTEQNCIIELTGKGPNNEPEKISIDKQEMALPHGEEASAAFGEVLKTKARAAEKSKLLLRADKDASSEAVLDVVDAIQTAAGDETMSTTQRDFLGALTISVETLVNAPQEKPEEKPGEAAAPAPTPTAAPVAAP